jgi:hypothetical protein
MKGKGEAQKFAPGKTVIMKNVMTRVDPSDILHAIFWHADGNWESMSEEDVAESGLKFESGFAWVSIYRNADRTELWVVTESDLSVTTVYLRTDFPNDPRRL